MLALPLLIASLLALAIAPPLLSFLRREGHQRPNYRQVSLPVPLGMLVPVASLLALVPLTLADQIRGGGVLAPELRVVAVYALGVALLGLLDDSFSASPRGWRGHAGEVTAGRFSTGAVKAAGSLGLALLALEGRAADTGAYVLSALLLVLCTNLFNLLDLRPGRSIKLLVALGVALTLGAADVGPLWALGLFLGPLLVAGLYDLRERAMLGDTGSNLAGALGGLWLVLTLSTAGQAVALAVIVAITVYGEFRSISEFVERAPVFRHLDSLGRPLNV
ncbi:MAG TPA: hypothetical protein VGN69_08510 [Solirubrobacteraceae bacterium]|nr:hypothetical protein [Solirubrobacteraceae bacterium]